MIYKTKELLQNGESEYSIRKKLKTGLLHLVERGLYSTDPNTDFNSEVFILKKYSHAILTGPSAFFIYGLTDQIPDYYHLATKQHSFPIKRDDVKQSYQEPSFFSVGVVDFVTDEGTIKTYDLERLLIELIRLKEKYPRELYCEVLESFRKIKNKIDFYKLNEYVKKISKNEYILMRIKEVL